MHAIERETKRETERERQRETERERERDRESKIEKKRERLNACVLTRGLLRDEGFKGELHSQRRPDHINVFD